ncbi:MAG: hypothetical protein KAT70_06465 [Thermoplasmata archaeon]|nr:hypothetical protein [Thermoplasmata archaeon]
MPPQRRIGADANDFYSTVLGDTVELTLSTTAVASAKLAEGRYLLILRADVGLWAWVKTREYAETVGVMASGVPATPLSRDAVISLEFNVRDDANQIRAVMESGTGILYLTPISRLRSL